jgi:DNA repair exonuclease SbcCD ATPase subunit
MTRFSLSFDELDVSEYNHNCDDNVQNNNFKKNDDIILEYSSDDESDEESGSTSSSIESEPRYSIGRTRFCLSHSESMAQYRRRWGYRSSSAAVASPTTMDTTTQIRQQDDATSTRRMIQSPLFPPLSNYMDPNTAPTAALVRIMMTTKQSPSLTVQGGRKYIHHEYSNDDRDDVHDHYRDMDQDMDRLATLLQAAAVMERYEPLLQLPSSFQQQQQQQRNELKIQKEMKWERQRIAREQEEAAQALRMLIRDQEEKAQQIRAAEQKLIQQQQQLVKAQAEETTSRHSSVSTSPPDIKASMATLEKVPQVAAATMIPEYMERAQIYKAHLVQLQANVKPFDTSTDANIKKRRLAMKKIVNGKVNTLAENAEKIREVATEVAKAIAQARVEDESIKEEATHNNSSAATSSPEASRGKRYLVNLLAEKVIVRAQAEGFNGYGRVKSRAPILSFK